MSGLALPVMCYHSWPFAGFLHIKSYMLTDTSWAHKHGWSCFACNVLSLLALLWFSARQELHDH